eukprot:TRINITY_DN1673_c0_g1_i1.p1 TRINITY_DN1673_c0_g1~~TRINITY_DN1673_c0_g1_i1.p1  ORF type:complete len:384 (-),score=115.61 TRINITY_DN1673_c0_g1_i1:42-1124(-)
MEALIQNLAGQSQSSAQNPEKLVTAEKYRNDGNEHFKKGENKKAMGAYHNALMYLKSLNGPSQEHADKAKAIKLACYLNLAAAQLKESNWEKVIKYSSEALTIEPNNVKALYRRGKAHHNDKNLDAAETDLETALRVDPNNAEVVQELRRVREKMKVHKEKEKQKFAGRGLCITYLSTTHQALKMEALIQNLAGQSQSSAQNPEKLVTAEKYRNDGNEHFKKGENKKAMGAYHNALMYLKSLNGPSQEHADKAKAIKLACYLNLAAAQLKESNWEKVIKYSSEALTIEPNNVKALYRRGKAHHNDKNLDAAETDLETALRVDPNNAEVVQELRRVREKMKVHKEKEKQKFAGFFDKLADE